MIQPNQKSEIKDQKCRLSPAWLLNLAQAYAAKGDLETAEKQVAAAYAENPDLKDGYARIGWQYYWEKKDYAKVIEYMGKDINYETPREALDKHEKEKTPEPKPFRDHARGMVNFSACPALRGVFSGQSTRLSPNMLLNLAQAYAAKGDLDAANRLVEEAYRLNDTLKDGYARCAWAAFGAAPDERIKALPYLENDYAASRLSAGQMLNLAMLRALNGDFDASLPLIEDAYAKNPDLKDGYARCAWAAFGAAPDERIKTLPWLEKDYAAGRLSPVYMLNLAQLHAQKGDLDAANRLVEEAYRLNETLKDGYARIGWQYYWEKKDYAKIIEYMGKDINYETSREALDKHEKPREALDKREKEKTPEPKPFRDHAQGMVNFSACPALRGAFRSSKLSAPWLINYAKAVSKTDGIEPAMELVERAYREQPELKNGYSQVAWQRFIPEDMAYEKVIPYFEKDIERGALNGEWQLNYAQALAVLGREQEAEKIVENAYAHDPSLKNGFARCGYQRHFMFYFEPEQAIEWFERDIKVNRLKGPVRINYASALAATEKIDQALQVVDQAYADDPQCVNGYSLVGWYGYVVSAGEPEKAIPLFERDEKLGRLRPNAKNLLAKLYALLGDRDKAEKMIADNYKADATLVGGYMSVGFCDYVQNKDLEYTYRMIERDKQSRRFFRPHHACLHAAVLSKVGECHKAELIITHVALRSDLIIAYTVAWLRRVINMNNAQIGEFITPHFKTLFTENTTALLKE